MKKIIFVVILFLPSCYQHRLQTLENNDKELAKAINCLANEECLNKLKGKKQ